MLKAANEPSIWLACCAAAKAFLFLARINLGSKRGAGIDRPQNGAIGGGYAWTHLISRCINFYVSGSVTAALLDYILTNESCAVNIGRPDKARECGSVIFNQPQMSTIIAVSDIIWMHLWLSLCMLYGLSILCKRVSQVSGSEGIYGFVRFGRMRDDMAW